MFFPLLFFFGLGPPVPFVGSFPPRCVLRPVRRFLECGARPPRVRLPAKPPAFPGTPNALCPRSLCFYCSPFGRRLEWIFPHNICTIIHRRIKSALFFVQMLRNRRFGRALVSEGRPAAFAVSGDGGRFGRAVVPKGGARHLPLQAMAVFPPRRKRALSARRSFCVFFGTRLVHFIRRPPCALPKAFLRWTHIRWASYPSPF